MIKWRILVSKKVKDSRKCAHFTKLSLADNFLEVIENNNQIKKLLEHPEEASLPFVTISLLA